MPDAPEYAVTQGIMSVDPAARSMAPPEKTAPQDDPRTAKVVADFAARGYTLPPPLSPEMRRSLQQYENDRNQPAPERPLSPEMRRYLIKYYNDRGQPVPEKYATVPTAPQVAPAVGTPPPTPVMDYVRRNGMRPENLPPKAFASYLNEQSQVSNAQADRQRAMGPNAQYIQESPGHEQLGAMDLREEGISRAQAAYETARSRVASEHLRANFNGRSAPRAPVPPEHPHAQLARAIMEPAVMHAMMADPAAVPTKIKDYAAAAATRMTSPEALAGSGVKPNDYASASYKADEGGE